MFEEYRRIEKLIQISNQKLESLGASMNGSSKEAFYRRKAKEEFTDLASHVSNRPLQPHLAVVAFYLLLADTKG